MAARIITFRKHENKQHSFEVDSVLIDGNSQENPQNKSHQKSLVPRWYR